MDKTILILHGWGSSLKSWIGVKEILEKKGNRVFVPDLPGFGESSLPEKPWSVSDYVEWVNKYAEKNNLSQFFLSGHSFGGRIAIKLSAKYLEKVSGLILIDSAGLDREKNLSFRQRIVFNFSKVRNIIVSFPFLGKILYPFFQKLSYFLAGNRDYYLIKNQVMKETFKKVISEDLSSLLPEIKAKTLIVWGEKDKLTPLESAFLIKKKVSNSILEVIPKIGHNPHLEAPDILADKILKFIQK
ncbi:MAG: alpha/beta hydrolase [Candidatus Nealsonbacteria bacterium]